MVGREVCPYDRLWYGFTDEMIISWNDNGWVRQNLCPAIALTFIQRLVLHYPSTCFEGLKAFRHPGGSVKIFRLDQNIKRFVKVPISFTCQLLMPR